MAMGLAALWWVDIGVSQLSLESMGEQVGPEAQPAHGVGLCATRLCVPQQPGGWKWLSPVAAGRGGKEGGWALPKVTQLVQRERRTGQFAQRLC